MPRADALEKTTMLGKIEGKRRIGQQRMKLFDGITNTMDMNLSKLWEIVKDRGAWHAAVHGVPKSQTWLSDYTTTTINTANKFSTVQGYYLISSPYRHVYNGPKHVLCKLFKIFSWFRIQDPIQPCTELPQPPIPLIWNSPLSCPLLWSFLHWYLEESGMVFLSKDLQHRCMFLPSWIQV